MFNWFKKSEKKSPGSYRSVIVLKLKGGKVLEVNWVRECAPKNVELDASTALSKLFQLERFFYEESKDDIRCIKSVSRSKIVDIQLRIEAISTQGPEVHTVLKGVEVQDEKENR